MNKIDTSDFKEISNSENLIKSWEMVTGEKKKTHVRKVVLTNKRLITIDKKRNTNHKKHSYNLEDIRAVDSCVSVFKRTSWLAIFLFFLATALVVAQAVIFGTNISQKIEFLSNDVNKLVCIIVPAVVAFVFIVVGVFLTLINKRIAGVTVSLKLKNHVNVEIAESFAHHKNLAKTSSITLNFPICYNAVEMVKELDNLIVEVQSKMQPTTEIIKTTTINATSELNKHEKLKEAIEKMHAKANENK